jgi:hypothetical protein
LFATPQRFWQTVVHGEVFSTCNAFAAADTIIASGLGLEKGERKLESQQKGGQCREHA